MRSSMMLVGILVSAVAAAEQPEVEARLEEAAAAAVALERVLDGRRPVGERRCQAGDCRPAEMNPSEMAREPEAAREDSVADDVAPGGEGSAGGMGGMGKMHPGGMGKMMGGMQGAKGGGSMATSAASGDPPDTSTPSADRVAKEGDASTTIEEPDDPRPHTNPSKP